MSSVDQASEPMIKPFHEATLARREMLTPGMVRLTFSGDGLANFRSTGIPDEYIRLFFPDPKSGELVLPTIEADGRWTFPEERHRVRYSTYTVRRFDAVSRELDIDLVVHEGGQASDWAMTASVGERIVINNPRGLYVPPVDLRWQLLIADATGLPAVARILEQTPSGIFSDIFVELADEAHVQDLPDHPGARVTWLTGSGNGIAESVIGNLLANAPRAQDGGYLWVAGEKSSVRELREQARTLPCFIDGRQKLVAYWSRSPEMAG
ncbi:siderophore-interacting protein [Bosea sp. (in: a-proteobacteria)]|jgi:NADPH-dependent ferric siderophore reductase|uniref:siderophore-interacting protein n=1 Tax=Bosea sp. (in: a-proteobacteria) TaxID=1871050 RepID=UPI002DDD8910|nr:siderophore-interacting protein [Bosea sp. (in: a-proteobacteria)]HEV2508829.1 siderophore-interacting protein [Bosea sp. (in: a-proteobacteria)]